MLDNNNIKHYLVSVEYSSCNNSVDETNQLIMTPNYPLPYKPKEACKWRMVAGCDEKIVLQFLDFQTEFLHDYIKIFDSLKMGKLGTYHGWTKPQDYKSHGNTLETVFVSDCFVHRKGFKIHYSAAGML